ncbi:MAG: TetR/AcrR family transcriptional regulator [Candidatus Dadabacteria bacterium]|nr:MAG: TetR/AcrR family transcriptional regulator [Candidatus Dadabacteria bacterium]
MTDSHAIPRRRGTRPGLTRAESRALTRSKLLRAARVQFAAHGLQGANLTDILREAEVSPGAFYHHFRDKLDLFLAVVDQMSERFRDMLRQSRELLVAPDGDLVEWVAGVYRLMLQITRENRELFVIYVREIHSGNDRINEFFERDQQSMGAEIQQILAELIARGTLPEIDPVWASYLVGILAQGGMLHQLSEEGDDEAWARAMAEFTLGGVQALTPAVAPPPRHILRGDPRRSGV